MLLLIITVTSYYAKRHDAKNSAKLKIPFAMKCKQLLRTSARQPANLHRKTASRRSNQHNSSHLLYKTIIVPLWNAPCSTVSESGVCVYRPKNVPTRRISRRCFTKKTTGTLACFVAAITLYSVVSR